MIDFHPDETDRRILRQVQRDAGLSNQQLAEAVGTSPASCWRRVRALEEAGLLGRHVRMVSPTAIGRGLDVFCQIRLKDQGPASRSTFERFIEGREEVVECYSISGDWDYLLHIVARDVADYERTLMHGILHHGAIAGSSSVFALKRVKHTTALPV